MLIAAIESKFYKQPYVKHQRKPPYFATLD